ncbi:hypothetical protein P9B03_19945 [Metasolibacillus meyeri]|uniref:Uncharacterized protein n=1 Tax=Metasolibacillus meyeri TaxID=1071052 RepID=A0AAW9NY09_9BACL|nr:hypothetical protein [Metasolibacillus meyeri]MEC1180729.1 hypothetical protein [Metasolibacillus meyeri]
MKRKIIFLLVGIFLLITPMLFHEQIAFLEEKNGLLMEVKVHNYFLFYTTFQTTLMNQTEDEVRIKEPVTSLYLSPSKQQTKMRNDIAIYITIQPNARIKGEKYRQWGSVKNLKFVATAYCEVDREEFAIHLRAHL